MSKFTFFWQNRSPFSNWYPSKFTHNGITFTRAEQYMMYQKAMLFGDTAVAQAILLTDNPKEQKDLGRLVSNYDDEKWAAVRVDVMVEGLYEKFTQDEKLKQALLDTGDTEIVEASPYDCIWGIGFTEDRPEARDKSKWRGKNLLGVTLMKVRDKIRNG
jgi:ribA/ribD-fused uncharacterized protein